MSSTSEMSELDLNKGATHHIDIKLFELSPIPLNQRCIFRVDDQLRNVNKESYQPNTIVIGPYHHHKSCSTRSPATTVQLMEEQKLRYLKDILNRSEETSVKKYVVAMQGLEERARKCYAEPIDDLNSDEFVEMMILDGCFIVEFLRKFQDEQAQENDPIFQMSHIFAGLLSDLLLFENQLPLFVLAHILDITQTSDTRVDNIFVLSLPFINTFGDDMAIEFVKNISREDLGEDLGQVLSVDGIEHLLGFLHYLWCYPFKKKLESQENLPYCSCYQFEIKLKPKENVAGREVRYIKSTTELQEAGIKFKAIFGATMFDINFEKGVMKIPSLPIYDGTESILRNLIAYEQYRLAEYPKYFTDYAFLMDCLVNSSKDVQILRHKGIIENGLGADEVVSTVFNKLCLQVCRSDKFQYSKLFTKVSSHCEKRRNRWMASLRRNYFHNPWAIISFFAALILLMLTVMQTVFSVLSFTKSA